MSERSETLPARSRSAAQLLPGDAIVVHRKPLTVVVAVDGDHATVAPVATAMVDHLIESGQWTFGPVAEALQSFVVSHQPVGVAAVLDVGPDPIAFLFDRAVVFEPTDTHRGDGRSGWTTVFVSGPQVVVAAGDDNLDDPSAPGWSRLIAGTVAGGGIRMALDASPAETQPQAEAVAQAAQVEDVSVYEPAIDESAGYQSAGHEPAIDHAMVDESAFHEPAIDHAVVDESDEPGSGADRFTERERDAAGHEGSIGHLDPAEQARSADASKPEERPRSSTEMFESDRADAPHSEAELEAVSADGDLGGSEPGDATTGGLRFDPFSPDESFFRSTPAGATTSAADGETDDGESLDGSEPEPMTIGEALPAEDPGHVPDGYDLEAPPEHDPTPAFDHETVTETWLPDDQATAQEPEHVDRGPSELDEAPSPAEATPTAAATTIGPTSESLEDVPPTPPPDALLARPEPSSAAPSPIGRAEHTSTQQTPTSPDKVMRTEAIDAASGTAGPLTGQPPMPGGALAGQPPTPDGPLAGQPPMPNGPLTGQPPMPGAPLTGQPPMPNGPLTGQPPSTGRTPDRATTDAQRTPGRATAHAGRAPSRATTNTGRAPGRATTNTGRAPSRATTNTGRTPGRATADAGRAAAGPRATHAPAGCISRGIAGRSANLGPAATPEPRRPGGPTSARSVPATSVRYPARDRRRRGPRKRVGIERPERTGHRRPSLSEPWPTTTEPGGRFAAR